MSDPSFQVPFQSKHGNTVWSDDPYAAACKQHMHNYRSKIQTEIRVNKRLCQLNPNEKSRFPVSVTVYDPAGKVAAITFLHNSVNVEDA